MNVAVAAGGVSLAIWIYLIVARDGFWLARERDEAVFPAPAAWPAVTAIVPARDEADVIGRAIGSLAAQAYPGDFRIILIDDGSSDGTADVARGVGGARLEIVSGLPLPRGWTGKLWAMAQGVEHISPSPSGVAGEPSPGRFRSVRGTDRPATGLGVGDVSPRPTLADRPHPNPSPEGEGPGPALLWFTDADIVHAPDTLAMLVARAMSERLVLHTLMAELRCDSAAERAFIPAFVFFFQMLYPFAALNDPKRRKGGAAGGCMLVDREALARAGGIATICSALIDDCALGVALKRQGPIRLSLTHRSLSIRPYGGWRDIGRMVSRSAYAQLGYAPWKLAGTLAGMGIVYLAPPLLGLFGHGAARWLGAAAWALMAIAFQPMLLFYRRSPLWGVALPAIAAFYTGATFASALDHWRGRGGMWKGRAQAQAGA